MDIGSILLGILAFVVLLSVIIIIHELGHLITAKKFGVYCHEFSIGMGPRLWHHKFKETTLSLRAIPFGGYVMMAGEDDGSEEDEEMKNVPKERRLNGIAAWKQVIIMAAGAFMNIMLAWIILIGINMVQGYVVVDTDPIIYEVQEGSPAEEAGLQPGDEIVALEAGGEVLRDMSTTRLNEQLQYYHDEAKLTVLRDGEEVSVNITPAYDEESKAWQIGAMLSARAEPITKLQAVGVATGQMGEYSTMIIRGIQNIVQGIGLDSVSGPVGIYQVTAETASMGLLPFLSLLALFSLNIGIFNLLPDPGARWRPHRDRRAGEAVPPQVEGIRPQCDHARQLCAGHRTDAVCDLQRCQQAVLTVLNCKDLVKGALQFFLDIKEEEPWNFAYCAIF